MEQLLYICTLLFVAFSIWTLYELNVMRALPTCLLVSFVYVALLWVGLPSLRATFDAAHAVILFVAGGVGLRMIFSTTTDRIFDWCMALPEDVLALVQAKRTTVHYVQINNYYYGGQAT